MHMQMSSCMAFTLAPCSSGVPCPILDLPMDSRKSKADLLWCLEGKVIKIRKWVFNFK